MSQELQSARPQPVEDDSPSTVLRWLEVERGSILTEREYQEMRETVIEELARGPHCRLSILITFGVVGLLLLVVTIIGLAIAVRRVVPDYTLGLVGLCALGAWAYALRSYVQAVRTHSRRSLGERLAELEGLHRENLITQAEFDRIYAAVHMSRGSRN